MSVRLLNDSYGKSRVRLLKVDRTSDRHEIQDLSVNIALEGEFDAIHREGDNRACLPTDTMKNTVYVLAGQTEEIETVESFGQRLATHFLSTCPHVRTVRLELFENGWKRIRFDDGEHDHSFVRGSDEKRTANITATRDGVGIGSGVEDLIVLKTTKSGFTGFVKDAYTTLPEVSDRVFSTAIKASWTYGQPSSATDEAFLAIRRSILKTFAEHDSLSVQHTLYAMGKIILESFADVAEIAFSLPNIHCLPIDLERFGLTNGNRIFVPTDEPHGLIEARMGR
jgi:urate oxidase